VSAAEVVVVPLTVRRTAFHATVYSGAAIVMASARRSSSLPRAYAPQRERAVSAANQGGSNPNVTAEKKSARQDVEVKLGAVAFHSPMASSRRSKAQAHKACASTLVIM
jgi:hypothetical protein